MPEGPSVTDDAIASSAIDLSPFITPSPYFITILSNVHEWEPKLLGRKSVMDALLSLYCVDAIPFRNPERAVPVAIDEHVMSECLQAARKLYYGLGGIGLMRRDEDAPPIMGEVKHRNVWPRIETAFREILRMTPREKLTVRDLDDILFAGHPNPEAKAFAAAVTCMILALRNRTP